MKVKHITALLMALTLTAALSACGGNKTSNTSSVSANKETGNEISKTSSAAVSGSAVATTAAVSKDEEATEEAVRAIAQAEPSSKPMEPTSDSSGSAEPATSKPKPDSSASGGTAPSKSKPKSTDSGGSRSSGSGSSSSGGSSGSGSGGGSAPSPVPDPTPAPTQPAPVPVHTHSWKEHTVTEQVWVPNIVVVDDYEDRVIDMSYFECDCGEKFEYTDAGYMALMEHGETNTLNAAYNGTKNTCGGYFICENFKIERVKVGSHEEDHGHYENSTRVDYYYCDCGARK